MTDTENRSGVGATVGTTGIATTANTMSTGMDINAVIPHTTGEENVINARVIRSGIHTRRNVAIRTTFITDVAINAPRAKNKTATETASPVMMHTGGITSATTAPNHTGMIIAASPATTANGGIISATPAPRTTGITDVANTAKRTNFGMEIGAAIVQLAGTTGIATNATSAPTINTGTERNVATGRRLHRSFLRSSSDPHIILSYYSLLHYAPLTLLHDTKNLVFSI